MLRSNPSPSSRFVAPNVHCKISVHQFQQNRGRRRRARIVVSFAQLLDKLFIVETVERRRRGGIFHNSAATLGTFARTVLLTLNLDQKLLECFTLQLLQLQLLFERASLLAQQFPHCFKIYRLRLICVVCH